MLHCPCAQVILYLLVFQCSYKLLSIQTWLCALSGYYLKVFGHFNLHMFILTSIEVSMAIATIEILCGDAQRLSMSHLNHLRCCLQAQMESGESSTEGSEVPRADVITNYYSEDTAFIQCCP